MIFFSSFVYPVPHRLYKGTHRPGTRGGGRRRGVLLQSAGSHQSGFLAAMALPTYSIIGRMWAVFMPATFLSSW